MESIVSAHTKIQILKSIHNVTSSSKSILPIVSAHTKIQILKSIHNTRINH